MNSTDEQATNSDTTRIDLRGVGIAAFAALATVILAIAVWTYGVQVGKEFADHWYLIRASMPLYFGVLAATTLAALYIASCVRAACVRVLDALDSHEAAMRREAFGREERILGEIRELAATIRDPLASLVNDSTAIAARLADLGADIQPTIEITQQLGEDLGGLLEVLRSTDGAVGEALRGGLNVEEADEVTGNRWFDGAMEAIRQRADEIEETYIGMPWDETAVAAACYEGAADKDARMPAELPWWIGWEVADRQKNLTMAGALYLIAAQGAQNAGVGHAHDHKLNEARRVAVLLAHHVKTEFEAGEREASDAAEPVSDEFMPDFKPVEKPECGTCDGSGTIDQTLGGQCPPASPEAPCPECNSKA